MSRCRSWVGILTVTMEGENTKLKNEVSDFLGSQLILHLAVSLENEPWICALEFIHDEELNFYWRSDATSHHSRVLDSNNLASVAVTHVDQENLGTGIQAEGRAEKVVDEEKIRAVSEGIDTKRGKVVDSEIAAQEAGRTYWKLRPTRLYYLNEARFGYDREEIVAGNR
ncbi:MAG: pyridoxamine 5'-phosphate oxidase family protein [Rubrobacteraceae bacterium]